MEPHQELELYKEEEPQIAFISLVLRAGGNGP